MSRVYPVLFFDPGTDATGWAATDREGTLLDCGLLRPKRGSLHETCPGARLIIHTELPVIYPRGKQKAKPRNILRLTDFAGQLQATTRMVGGNTAQLETHEPRDWKGQLPDDVLYNRVLDALTKPELDLIFDRLLKVADGLWHNVYDALGLWLHTENRL